MVVEHKHRTIFISDVHLGARGCRADLLVDFLKSHEAETLYLVGDIFDGWKLKRGWHWTPVHNQLVETVLAKARLGTRVIYIPGNHDEGLRNFFGSDFGAMEVKANDVHVSASGKRYLVTHGDEFDVIVSNAKWLAYLGDRLYAALIWLNPKINAVRSLFTRSYWSLSKWAKHQVKQAVNFIGEYERALVAEARLKGYDGVICGHIHHAAISDMDGIEYINTGDWVESCTAIVEDHDGKMHLIDWEAKLNRQHLRDMARRRKTNRNERDVA